jgi:hypothetical protein
MMNRDLPHLLPCSEPTTSSGGRLTRKGRGVNHLEPPRPTVQLDDGDSPVQGGRYARNGTRTGRRGFLARRPSPVPKPL